MLLLRRFRRRKAVSDPVTVVSRFVDAANRHDADAIAKCLHPDFESIQPIYPSRNFRGSMQVKRNWQAIFESEPGFRLSLVRSASNEGTVWVELHGAGRDVEVAGVFIMGVEDELVRWARVYSAVVEQPPAKMAAADPASTVAAERGGHRPRGGGGPPPPHRRRPSRGRGRGRAAEARTRWATRSSPRPPRTRWSPPTSPAAVIAADAEDADDEDDDDEDDDDDDDDDDSEDDDDDEYDEDDDEDDDDEDDEDDDDDADEDDEMTATTTRDDEARRGDPGGAGDRMEAVVADAAAAAEAAAEAAEADLPGPYADPDSFWQEGELHDLVGSPLSGRRRGPGRQRSAATATSDALVVDINGRRADAGDDPER